MTMQDTLKTMLRERSPQFYRCASALKQRLFIEAKILRQVGPKILFNGFLKKTSSWQEVLPVQKPRRILIPNVDMATLPDLIGYLAAGQIPFCEGGHTVYLPPGSVEKSAFKILSDYYPRQAGVKIMKNPGTVDQSEYVHGSQHSALHKMLIHSHKHLSLVANFIHLQGMGPRLFDLVELRCGSTIWTAYVISHCSGRTPTMAECEAGISRVRQWEKDQLIKVVAPGGLQHMDFTCPDCNHNCLMEERSGTFQYFDFQNFLLTGYETFLENTAVAAAEDTHFGDRSFLRGGRYLYQSVPGVRLPAKRDIESRIPILQQLMVTAKVSVEDRLVLDFGCNIGMMIGQYLKAGAMWCHGWDMERVTIHTERLLLALGCTRFSLTSGSISQDQAVTSNLPEFLHKSLSGCVISYLAVRGHIGWLDALARIPWSFMIYEGHEGETTKDFEKHLAQLGAVVPVDVASSSEYRDGDSDKRLIAILIRR